MSVAEASLPGALQFALLVENGPHAGHHIPLQHNLTLGRGAAASVALSDPRLSRRHARVDLVDGVPVLVDLGSANGSYVNNQQMRVPTALWVGDQVLLGDTRLRVVSREVSERAIAPGGGAVWRWPWQQPPGEPLAGTLLRWLASAGTALLAAVAVILLLVAVVQGEAVLVFFAEVLGLLAFAHAWVAGRLAPARRGAYLLALGLAAAWSLAALGAAVSAADVDPLLAVLVAFLAGPPLAVAGVLLLPAVRRAYWTVAPPDGRTPAVPVPSAAPTATAPATGPALASAEQALRLGPFGAVPDDWRAWLAAQARVLQHAPRDLVLREGDRDADLWCVLDGELEVVGVGLGGAQLPLGTLQPGDWFGEMAILTSAPRTASVRALTAARVLRLPADAVRQALAALPPLAAALRQRADHLDIVGFLQRYSPFAGLPAPAVAAVARRCKRYRAAPGTVLVREGQTNPAWYLIKDGRAEVLWPDGRRSQLGPGDSFGERELLAGGASPCTITATTNLEVLALARADFQAVVATYPRLRRFFGELLRARYAGAPDQALVFPDPITTVMPGLSASGRGTYWRLLLGGIGILAVLSVISATTGVGLAIVATILVGAFLAPAVYLRYLWERDFLRTLSWWRLALIGLSAGVVGILLASELNNVFGSGVGELGPSLRTGLVEETVKLASVAWLMWHRRYRFELDGIVFGVAAGMAFAGVENIFYAARFLDSGGISGMLTVVWARGITTFVGHAVWTGLICAAVWRGKQAGGLRWALGVAGAFALSVLLHALWDWSTLIFVIPVAFVGTVLLRQRIQAAIANEQRSIAALALPSAEQTGTFPIVALPPCPSCGAEAVRGNLYCARCGAAIIPAANSGAPAASH